MMKTIALILTIFVATSQAGHGRSLLQGASPPTSATTGLRIPANADVVETLKNVTAASTDVLGQAGRLNLTQAQDFTLDEAHEAAEGLFGVAAAGQSSAVHAGVATCGAALLAGGGAYVNDPSVISQARQAITQANALIAAVRDNEILTVSASEFANLDLLANLAHDGTLIHYYQSAASGPNDNETFSETVEGAENVYETVEEQLQNGLSQALAVIAAESVAHNLLGAIYTYQGNNASVARENIYQAQTLLKAVRARQTNATCATTWAAVDPIIEKAYDSAVNASTALTPASITQAITDAQAAVSAAQCGAAVSPSLAPVQAVSAAGK